MRGVHVALLHGKSFLCTTYMYYVSLWPYSLVPVFSVLVKYALNTRVPNAYQVIKLRTRYLPAALLSITRRRCDVCMANRSCYERAAMFLKTGLKIAAPLRTRRLCSVGQLR